jgi:hypothetical protein
MGLCGEIVEAEAGRFCASTYASHGATRAAAISCARDPIQRFTAAAVEVGLIRAGDKLDRNVVELCLRVVEMAAEIGDAYRVPNSSEDSVGTRIRAELHE